jgi:hypothetical protein
VNGTLPAQDVAVEISLKAGWNLIGTPFASPVTFSLANFQVREPGKTAVSLGSAAGVASSFMWGWKPSGSSGSYVLVTDTSRVPSAEGTLKPWLGYWMKASKACTLIIPAP